MHKISKNSKYGFTLVEMTMVVAIIVILATVLTINIAEYFDTTDRAVNTMNSQVTAMHRSNASQNSALADYGF
jgi:prepilin-type N-terminal cleavage/methylation domain-containing protein